MSDWSGRDIVLVVAKMCYQVDAAGSARVARGPAPIRTADTWSEGPNPSLRLPSDLTDDKPGTDVLLVGTAQAPAGETTVDVGLHIRAAHGIIEKYARVFGTRVWFDGLLGPEIGPPAAFQPTPLHWELTYGGSDTSGPEDLVDWRNPAGCSVAHDPLSLLNRPAPVIEDPQRPGEPVGFGPVAPQWSPRRELAGTYDQRWRTERAPLPPTDFDSRHNSCAPRDLWSQQPLYGDEPVVISGVTTEPVWQFQLPRYTPTMTYSVGHDRYRLQTHLDTVLIDADARTVELTWRARIPVPRKLAFISRICVVANEKLPVTSYLSHGGIQHVRY